MGGPPTPSLVDIRFPVTHRKIDAGPWQAVLIPAMKQVLNLQPAACVRLPRTLYPLQENDAAHPFLGSWDLSLFHVTLAQKKTGPFSYKIHPQRSSRENAGSRSFVSRRQAEEAFVRTAKLQITIRPRPLARHQKTS